MNLTVVSTGFRPPTRRICEASVRVQTVKARHVIVDAAEQSPPKIITQNLYETIGALDPADVVVWLDADDWLARENALAHVVAMHEAGALVTYGSYIDSDGNPGVCAPYARSDYRREPWRASHLKTFRAGLFQQLAPEDLQLDGKWLDVAADVAVMLPLLEMAGQDRVIFCAETLCIYHRPSSFESKASREERQREKDAEAALRAKAPKARVA